MINSSIFSRCGVEIIPPSSGSGVCLQVMWWCSPQLWAYTHFDSSDVFVLLVNSKVVFYSVLRYFFLYSVKGQFHHDGFCLSSASVSAAHPARKMTQHQAHEQSPSAKWNYSFIVRPADEQLNHVLQWEKKTNLCVFEAVRNILQSDMLSFRLQGQRQVAVSENKKTRSWFKIISQLQLCWSTMTNILEIPPVTDSLQGNACSVTPDSTVGMKTPSWCTAVLSIHGGCVNTWIKHSALFSDSQPHWNAQNVQPNVHLRFEACTYAEHGDTVEESDIWGEEGPNSVLTKVSFLN